MRCFLGRFMLIQLGSPFWWEAAHSKVSIILLESSGRARCTRAHSPFATPRLSELLQSFAVVFLGRSPSM